MNETLKRNLDQRENSRILSLDGGGIKGLVTLGILEKLEEEIKYSKGESTRLCDYFDLIGGTSTGSIIASGLAIGKSVSYMIDMYQSLGKEIFRKGFISRNTQGKDLFDLARAIKKENYSSELLASHLKADKVFGNICLGDQNNIETGLVINSKRADTYSLWSVANHPEGKYYEANKHLKLWELCKASSSAPYYFKPTKLNIKTRKGEVIPTAFIDGGVSLANNPAWQLFLVSTVPTFGFKKKYGGSKIHIYSIGTGKSTLKSDADVMLNKRTFKWAPEIPNLFMTDALEMNHILLNVLGDNLGSELYIDSQFGNMNEPQYLKEKLFRFQRFNPEFNNEFLKEIKVELSNEQVSGLGEMDDATNINALLDIGRKYAATIDFIID